jgi:hypothetical protein
MAIKNMATKNIITSNIIIAFFRKRPRLLPYPPEQIAKQKRETLFNV